MDGFFCLGLASYWSSSSTRSIWLSSISSLTAEWIESDGRDIWRKMFREPPSCFSLLSPIASLSDKLKSSSKSFTFTRLGLALHSTDSSLEFSPSSTTLEGGALASYSFKKLSRTDRSNCVTDLKSITGCDVWGSIVFLFSGGGICAGYTGGAWGGDSFFFSFSSSSTASSERWEAREWTSSTSLAGGSAKKSSSSSESAGLKFGTGATFLLSSFAFSANSTSTASSASSESSLSAFLCGLIRFFTSTSAISSSY